MNDAWGYDDNAEQTEPGHNDGPKALRDAYAALKAQNDQILAQLASVEKERTKEKLSSVFSELGVPGAADLYQGEPDPEKARAWAESMRAAFGSGSAQQAQTPADVPTPPALDAQAQQQYQQMTEAGQNGNPLTSIEAAGVAITGANSLAELIAANQAAQHLR
jgi:hypothetical protein